ncbi:ATP-dependent endonuclease [Flavobacterium gyeonganense]|uniref:ATP-dependent endonuclease n=1 Tax=Flavobacterium gyeonganense TaxID=1310418 RepID=A0ABV5HFH2_9FLAO|nr:AAA family ATPase [Flavobacterium gyeonganense]
MRIDSIDLQNFRKLKKTKIELAEKETVFVGANNSGKTSSLDALRIFLTKKIFSTRDFTLDNWIGLNKIGNRWLKEKEISNIDLSVDQFADFIPTLDLWLHVEKNEAHYVLPLIPTLEWKGGRLGIRMRFEPQDVETLYKEFILTQKNKKDLDASRLKLWPDDLWDFLDKKNNLNKLFTVRSYLLNPLNTTPFQPLPISSLPLEQDVLKGLIKVNIINAQRGFSDVGSDTSETSNIRNLSNQLRDYYDKHLNPSDNPTKNDLKALGAINDAKKQFDENLQESFKSALGELAHLNYPGFGNPTISLSSRIDTVESLNHDSSVQYSLSGDNPKLSLPEKYNGLGYQNLISMIFKLIRFRDDWMNVGKKLHEENAEEFQPLHLVIIEEPEAHLHAQVQQVFIKEAYKVLRNHPELGGKKQFHSQLLISTHSNHIAHEIDFTALRYFKRNPRTKGSLSTSTVVNLSTTFGSEDRTTKFAIRYLKTTHSDLFFADAVIIVEGPVERMLVPHFIKNQHNKLSTCYISILEIGGSHAHTLLPLLEQLGIITLIITDIDTIITPGKTKCQPKRASNQITNNDTLKKILSKSKKLDDLYEVKFEKKLHKNHPIRVAFQIPIQVSVNNEALPYTFEDSLVMENKNLFSALPTATGLLQKMILASKESDINNSAKAMYECITAKSVKKAEFALELLYLKEPNVLEVPQYIKEGLVWMEEKLEIKK